MMSKDTADQILINDEKVPILYNAKGQPLTRPVGFQVPVKTSK